KPHGHPPPALRHYLASVRVSGRRHLHALHSFPTRRSSDLHAATDVAAGGPVRELLRGHESDSPGSALALQLMGSMHRSASAEPGDRKSTRLNSSHDSTSYAVFCLKKKTRHRIRSDRQNCNV